MHEKLTIEPWVVSPSGIAHELLDEDAVRTVQRLAGRNYEAYFVGGCVRDILLGRQPKDFDIATAARPQQVKRTFPRNCRIIGRRFKLAHLHFDGGRKILEVSTFRRTPEENGGTRGGGESSEGDEPEPTDLLITHDNEFGNAEEDALRRDFTVNALFFDPLRDRIIDYVGGMRDLEERVIRTIGDPVVRFREDPVRILRAAKFAGRLGFHVAPSTLDAMAQVAPDLRRSAPPRLLEEILRLLRGGHALDSFQLLRDVGAIQIILPLVGTYLERAPSDERIVFWRLLEALDGRVHSGHVPSTPVLLGTLFTRAVAVEAQRRPHESPTIVAEQLLGDLTQTLRLPRRDAGFLKRICSVQSRFAGRQGKRFRPDAFARDPSFPPALDLFELTCQATGEEFDVLAQWRSRGASVPAPAEFARAHDDDDGDDPAEPEVATRELGDDDDDGRLAESDAADAPFDAEGGEAAEGGDAETTTDDAAADEAEGEREGEPAQGGGRRKRRRRRGRRGRNRDRHGDAQQSQQPGGGEPGPEAEGEGHHGEAHATADDAEPFDAPSQAMPADAASPSAAPRGERDQQRHRQQGRREQGHREQGSRDQGNREPGQREQSNREPRPEQRRDDAHEGREGRRKRRRNRRDREQRREEQRREERRGTPPMEVTPRGEAPDFDRTILEQAIDPKEVPTFGALVEGGKGPKRRRPPRITVEEELGDPYRPPPHRTDGDGPPPPPPPPPPGHDVFGDW